MYRRIQWCLRVFDGELSLTNADKNCVYTHIPIIIKEVINLRMGHEMSWREVTWEGLEESNAIVF